MKLVYTPPAGWRFPTIEEIAAPEQGAVRIGPFGSALKKNEYSESGVRVLGIEDVFPNELVSDNRKYIPELKFRELSQYLVRPGDILVTNMGTVGRTCVVPDGLEKSIISSHLIKVSLDLRAAWPPYISWMLNFCPLVVAQIRAKCHGAIMAGFNSSLLKQLRIPLPPLPEQRRIADVLDRAWALRAKRRAALAQLDTLTQSIFLDMFGDPATNPKGWAIKPLGDAMSEVYRYPTYYDITYVEEGVPEIRGELLQDDGSIATDRSRQRYIPPQTSARFPRTVLDEGDLVMSVRGTIGKIGLVPSVLAGANITANLIRLAPDRRVLNPKFAWHFTRTAFFKGQLANACSSTTILTIKAPDLKRITIPLPPLDLQREFARRAAGVERLKATHRASLSELGVLFASLQQRAFRGDL